MDCKRLLTFARVGALQCGEEVEVRNLCVHDDHALARQVHHQVWLAFSGLRLFGEITMGTHSRRFHDATERLLTPPATCLIRFENHSELLCFLGQRLALLGQGIELPFDFA